MRESSIQSIVAKHARSHGVLARKLSFGEGFPDFVFLYAGRVLFIEFKKPGEKPTPLQEHVGQLLRNKGFQVEVVDDVDKGLNILRQWREL